MPMKKCCLCIPLRAGTFLIALWFFIIAGFEAITGFLGRNAVLSYVSQTNIVIFWIEESLAILVALSGLVGIIGTCSASRRFIRIFSIVIWISCVISIIQHVSSLVIVSLNRQIIIDECAATGKLDVSPAEVTSLYTPINRNNSLSIQADSSSGFSPNSSSAFASCTKEVEIFVIVAAVVILVIQFLQFYFATVVGSYAAKLTSQPKHTKLMNQQEWDEQQMPMRESVY